MAMLVQMRVLYFLTFVLFPYQAHAKCPFDACSTTPNFCQANQECVTKDNCSMMCMCPSGQCETVTSSNTMTSTEPTTTTTTLQTSTEPTTTTTTLQTSTEPTTTTTTSHPRPCICSHGSCNNGARTCICNKGWTGESCDISCTDHCDQGGTCVEVSGKVTCIPTEIKPRSHNACSSEYVLRPEAERSCMNISYCKYGTCTIHDNGFYCQCDFGVSSSKRCEYKCCKDCGDNGTCYYHEELTEEVCHCETNYRGTLCEIYDPPVPLQPRNLQAKAISPNEIEITWSAPEDVAKIISYTLYYNDSEKHTIIHHKIYPPTTLYKLSELIPDTVYNIQLAARSAQGEGARTILVQEKTPESTPTAPPQSVSGRPLSHNSIHVEWSPPPANQQNGNIQGYRVLYVVNEDGITEVEADVMRVGVTTRAQLENLETWADYKIWVVAFTAAGDSPMSPPIIVKTHESEREKVQWWFYLLVLLIPILVMTLLTSLFLVYLWKRRVIVVLKAVRSFQAYEDDDERQWDAFISYRSNTPDEDYVIHTLFPKLTQEMGFSVNVHYKDFIPGNEITNNIIYAVENSRRTILVVSPHYLTSNFTKMEWQLAQQKMLERKNKIIPILLEDISSLKDTMDPNLKSILDSVTYIEWPGDQSPKGDKFWQRISLSMPKKKKHPLI